MRLHRLLGIVAAMALSVLAAAKLAGAEEIAAQEGCIDGPLIVAGLASTTEPASGRRWCW